MSNVNASLTSCQQDQTHGSDIGKAGLDQEDTDQLIKEGPEKPSVPATVIGYGGQKKFYCLIGQKQGSMMKTSVVDSGSNIGCSQIIRDARDAKSDAVNGVKKRLTRCETCNDDRCSSFPCFKTIYKAAPLEVDKVQPLKRALSPGKSTDSGVTAQKLRAHCMILSTTKAAVPDRPVSPEQSRSSGSRDGRTQTPTQDHRGQVSLLSNSMRPFKVVQAGCAPSGSSPSFASGKNTKCSLVTSVGNKQSIPKTILLPDCSTDAEKSRKNSVFLSEGYNESWHNHTGLSRNVYTNSCSSGTSPSLTSAKYTACSLLKLIVTNQSLQQSALSPICANAEQSKGNSVFVSEPWRSHSGSDSLIIGLVPFVLLGMENTCIVSSGSFGPPLHLQLLSVISNN